LSGICLNKCFPVLHNVTDYLVDLGFSKYNFMKVHKIRSGCNVLSPEALDSGNVRKILKIISMLGSVACNPIMYSCRVEGVVTFSVLT
jgi:hypothetical protein